MTDFHQTRPLGRTGLNVGRLGMGASYGASAEAFELAFERGCNYFYWGASRKSGMAQVIKHIISRGQRDDLVVAVHAYARRPWLLERSLKRALRDLGQPYVDVLILGYHQKRPRTGLLDLALTMRDRGLTRFVGMSSHNRSLVSEMADEGLLDLFHVRYNAAHRGAEREVFPHLPAGNRPGVVSFTATRWGDLLKPKRMPPDQPPPPASHCYRFALSHPDVDVCLAGPRNRAEVEEALRTLDLGPLGNDEMELMRGIGDHVYRSGNWFYDRRKG